MFISILLDWLFQSLGEQGLGRFNDARPVRFGIRRSARKLSARSTCKILKILKIYLKPVKGSKDWVNISAIQSVYLILQGQMMSVKNRREDCDYDLPVVE